MGETILKSEFIKENFTEKELSLIETSIKTLKISITKERYLDSIRYCDWIRKKVDLNLKANQYFKIKFEDKKNHFHPIRPKRGEIYLAEMGENIGAEINKQHLVLILQNDKGNLYSDTVVVIPISSSTKLYKTHEKIIDNDIKDGRLDKLPSKAKTEQIHYLDKARLIHKVATLKEDCILRVCNRLKNNLKL